MATVLFEGNEYPIPTDDITLPSFVMPEIERLRNYSVFCWDMYDPTRFYHPILGPVDLERCKTYFPKEELEDGKVYRDRLGRSRLTRRHRSAVDGLSDLLSNFGVTGISPELEKLTDDINLFGDSLSQFFRRVDRFALNDLVTGVYVDTSLGTPANRLEQRDNKTRPWLAHFSLADIHNYSFRDGRLWHVTFSWRDSLPSGYGVSERTLFQVLTPGLAETYEIVGVRGLNGVEFQAQMESRVETGLDFIPFVFYGLAGTDFGGTPPLYSSAELTLHHAKKSSDVAATLHASVPTPVRSGLKYDSSRERPPIVIGPSYGIDLPAEGKFYWAEPAGACLAAAQIDLATLVAELDTFTLSLFSEPMAGVTATESGLRSASTTTTLYGMAMAKESHLQTLLSWLELFMGRVGLPTIHVDKQLLKTPVTLESALQLLDRGLVSEDWVKYRFTRD